MTKITTADKLHRLVKQALDNGTAASIAEAEAMFGNYRLGISISDGDAQDQHHQAALLTTVALARRVFLGGVYVDGNLDAPLSAPLPSGDTLAEAVTVLGGVAGHSPSGVPMISIGHEVRDNAEAFHIRTVFDGWRGGIVPVKSSAQLVATDVMPLAPMLAAGLAVNEAFKFVSERNPIAGREPVGMSLWSPAPSTDWLSDQVEPRLEYVPSRLWLVGLGHLGQAYLWALGLLPYDCDHTLDVVLQDIDVVTPSTESTSILTDGSLVGELKTRVMASWAERRGFRSRIVERYFDEHFRRHDSEPAVALCGLDNALGRRALEKVGFELVVEAGLGRGHRDFRSLRLHTLPGPRAASELWPDEPLNGGVEEQAAYRSMLQRGELDQCGVTLLAGKAVGAPFVGVVAACLAISEILRHLHGGPLHQLMDVNLACLQHRIIAEQTCDFSSFNPGFMGV